MSDGRRLSWISGLLLAVCLPVPGAARDAPKSGLPAGAVARLGQSRLRHAEKPTCVAFAPDGKSFVTGGEDGSVRVWSVATGEQLNLIQKPTLGVTALQYTHGGRRLAVQCGNDGLIRFLDAATFRETGSLPFVNRHRFALSADGALVAASDPAGGAVVTEVATDLPKLELADVTHFDFRPDGKALAAGDAAGTATVYLVTGGKPAFTVKSDGAVQGVVFGPTGARLAVGWRTANGADVVRVYEPGRKEPAAEIPGMSRPRSWVGADAVAVGNGTEAGVYDVVKKQWVGRVKGIAGEFAVSPDGTKLAATGNGLRVRLYDLPTGNQLHADNDAFPDPVLLAGSADGRCLFLLTAEAAYLWPVGAAAAAPASAPPGRAVAAAAAGDVLVVATPDAVVAYAPFDPTRPLPDRPTHTFKDSGGAKAVAVSADGGRVAWVGRDGRVVVTDPAEKAARTEVPSSSANVLAIGLDPAGGRLAVLGRDPFLRVWDVSAGRAEPKELWKGRVQRGVKGQVAFSPDGKLLTAVSTAQLVVFDAAGAAADDPREPLHRFERYTENGQLQHVAFSPDGRLLVVGATSTFGNVEVWELATRRQVRGFATGYGGTARLCVFPDGRRAASAGAEEAITVWDLTFGAGPLAPADDALRAAADKLGSADAAVGYPAVKVLAAAGDRGAKCLGEALNEHLAAEKKIRTWVADLGSPTFALRETAAKELLARGARALPAVAAAAGADDSELRDRAREVLGKLTEKGFTLPADGMTEHALRLFRAAQALEDIGTADARAVLAAIAATAGRPADEARAALARLNAKKK